MILTTDSGEKYRLDVQAEEHFNLGTGSLA